MGLISNIIVPVTGAGGATFSTLANKAANSAFKLIDVAPIFSASPTTSENMVITSTRVNDGATLTKTAPEYTVDPSAGNEGPYRFDKEHAKGTTVSVAYTNTDTFLTHVVFLIEVLESN